VTRNSAQAHADLALALTQRARETADPVYYQQAEAAVQAALAATPGHFDARKVRAWALLGQHRFAEALALATALNREVPDDLMVYGILTDAHIELGHYDEAERSAQWMLDLRPGNIPALTRAAYLRELFGDIEGAIELMRAAVNRMPFQETEDRAWVLTQIGHLELVRRQPAGGRARPCSRPPSQLFPRLPLRARPPSPTCAPRSSGYQARRP
jgi:tetratricopeptide (TPR) repeat protein